MTSWHLVALDAELFCLNQFSVVEIGDFPDDGSDFASGSDYLDSTLGRIRIVPAWYDEVDEAEKDDSDRVYDELGRDLGRYAMNVSLGGSNVEGLGAAPFGLGTTIVHIHGDRLGASSSSARGRIVCFYLKGAPEPALMAEYLESAKQGRSRLVLSGTINFTRTNADEVAVEEDSWDPKPTRHDLHGPHLGRSALVMGRRTNTRCSKRRRAVQ